MVIVEEHRVRLRSFLEPYVFLEVVQWNYLGMEERIGGCTVRGPTHETCWAIYA